MTAAVIYARAPAPVAELRALAATRGLSLVGEFIEDRGRHQLCAMRAAVGAGAARVVLVPTLAHLSPDVRSLVLLVDELRGAGAAVLALDGFDSRAQGVAFMVSKLAEVERERVRARAVAPLGPRGQLIAILQALADGAPRREVARRHRITVARLHKLIAPAMRRARRKARP